MIAKPGNQKCSAKTIFRLCKPLSIRNPGFQTVEDGSKAVKGWLARKAERFQVHFTPTGSSWMNLVERLFRDITQDVIRQRSSESVCELSEAIFTYLADHYEHPKPYRWKAKGEEILAKIQRAREAQAKAAAAANA